MSRVDLDVHFSKIDDLVVEINGQVPPGTYRGDLFRSDLAGLLVVAMAATYETCVKEVLYSYANDQHVAFGDFALRNYDRLNSRVQVKDLKKYCEIFDPLICARFKTRFSDKKKALLDRTGKNIETSYERNVVRANSRVAA
jgi:hypothetical protein